jgi:hypothetical protein
LIDSNVGIAATCAVADGHDRGAGLSPRILDQSAAALQGKSPQLGRILEEDSQVAVFT